MVENRLGEPLSSERAPCRARGTPTRATTTASWRPCSPGPWVGVGTRRRCRRSRFVPGDPRGSDSSARRARSTRVSCAPFSTCAAIAGRRSPPAAATHRCCRVPTTRGSTGSTGRWLDRRGSANPRGSIPTTTACSPSRSRRSPVRSSSTSIRERNRSTPGRSVPRSIPYRLDELELGERTAYDCAFNWKVLLENYCENYHTPFVHSQLPNTGYEYPIVTEGPVVFAWDRPLAPRDASERALHDFRPGDTGWADVADVAAPESFNNGGYFTLFPNTAISCFAGFAASFRLTPTGPSTTHRRARVLLASVGTTRASRRRPRRDTCGGGAGPHDVRGRAAHV